MEGSHEIVEVGATVVVDFGEGPETYRYETIAGEGCIGSTSPIGAALGGKRAGDYVQVQTPGGSYRVQIVAVS